MMGGTASVFYVFAFATVCCDCQQHFVGAFAFAKDHLIDVSRTDPSLEIHNKRTSRVF